MPSASRLSGDQYQHLYSWLRMLDLMGPNPRAKTVWVERDDALHADDVVIEPTDKTRPLEFIQVKFHVNMRTSYSSSELIRIDANAATSILGKLFKSWQKLHSETDQLFELKLLSNWVWATDDPLGKYVSGRDNRAFRRFITDTDSSIAQIREAWLDHLSCSVDELAAFLEHTRFRLGYDDYTDLWQRTAHTMGLLGLNDTDKDILACISKVGHMIVEGPKEIDGEILQSIVNELTLVQPFEEDAFVPVYVQTIEPELLSQPSPYEIDWCGDFAGRSVYDNGVWNSKFLPELRSIKQHIISTTETRLLKVRGQARLSIWVALGYVFSSPSGFRLAVRQVNAALGEQEEEWRTDAHPSDYRLDETWGVIEEGSGNLIVSISISRDVRQQMETYLDAANLHAGLWLHFEPVDGPSRQALLGGAEAVAAALQIADAIAKMRDHHPYEVAHLFYSGPVALAAFIGHQLNACGNIQIYEHQDPGYLPSFFLTDQFPKQ